MFDFYWKKHRKKKEREKKMIKYMKIYMIALSLLVILLGGIDASAAARLQVSFIDAGQGSAIFIQSGGKNTLIDAGDEKYYEKLKKFLVKKKLKKIDQLVITHNDPDHIGNADKVISKYGVRTVIQAKYGYDREAKTKDVKDFRKAVNKYKVRIVKVTKGSTINFGSVKGTVLSPGKKYKKTNQTSLVIRVIQGKHRFLFTGGMYSSNEKDIMKKYDVKSTVLQVPHHGSYTSGSTAFLKKAKPEYAVISCGKSNPYHHPRPEVMKQLKKYAKKIYQTDKNGTVTFSSDGKN